VKTVGAVPKTTHSSSSIGTPWWRDEMVCEENKKTLGGRSHTRAATKWEGLGEVGGEVNGSPEPRWEEPD